MISRTPKLVARILPFLALSSLLAPTVIRGQIPQLISYQGRVTASGTNLDGTGQFKFALVSSNAASSFWSNDGTSIGGSEPTSLVTLPVVKGLFTVLLGDTSLSNMTGIPPAIFANNSDVRLRVWFSEGTNAFQLLAPDQRITAVGYAMTAGNVPDGAITSAKLAPGSVTSNLLASGQSSVASGGMILSDDPNSTNLISVGYVQIGKLGNLPAAEWQPGSGFGNRYDHSAIWTGTEMIIWGGSSTVPPYGIVNTGARYNPASDSWTPISTNGAPPPQSQHTAIWTGSEMIVWGGYFNDFPGGRYNPTTDSWLPMATNGAATMRYGHTAVWTGSEMIIWGGIRYNGVRLGDGGRYNPSSNTWSPMATNGAPVARWQHTAVWTGSEMIIWGGEATNSPYFLQTGARYNPLTDTWADIASPNLSTPPGSSGHTAVWTGAKMIVWGGSNGGPTNLNTGGKYDPAANTWTAIPTASAPGGRRQHTAVWTGSEMIIWGGMTESYSDLDTGARYNPNWESWMPTSTNNTPTARISHTAIWTGSEMIIYGGNNQDGLIFDVLRRYTPPTARTLYLYSRP